MSQAEEREPAGSAATAVHHFLSRLRDWWRRHSEFDTMDPEELERIAKDLGMTGPESPRTSRREDLMRPICSMSACTCLASPGRTWSGSRRD